MTLRVAAVQFAPSFKRMEANIQKMVALATEAAMGGAKLIVLPELSTTGYSFMSTEEAQPFAEVVTDFEPGIDGGARSSMTAMHAVAKKHGVIIVWGLIRRDYGSGKIFNAQVYMEPSGYFEKVDKINLWGNDFLWADEGQSNPPVIRSSITGKRVGLLVCRDIRDKKNDDWSNFYSRGDADVVAFSSNFGKGGFPSTSWMEFAKDNGVWLIVSNRYGIESHNDFGDGGICVIEPEGKVHCKGLSWGNDCIVYAEVK